MLWNTHTLNVTSGIIVRIGISISPSQNTADENSITYMPVMIVPTGITGQKLLQREEF